MVNIYKVLTVTFALLLLGIASVSAYSIFTKLRVMDPEYVEPISYNGVPISVVYAYPSGACSSPGDRRCVDPIPPSTVGTGGMRQECRNTASGPRWHDMSNGYCGSNTLCNSQGSACA